MTYQVVLAKGAEKDLRGIRNRTIRRRLSASIEALANDPYPRGAVKLRGVDEIWRIRAGDWRICYTVQAEPSGYRDPDSCPTRRCLSTASATIGIEPWEERTRGPTMIHSINAKPAHRHTNTCCAVAAGNCEPLPQLTRDDPSEFRLNASAARAAGGVLLRSCPSGVHCSGARSSKVASGPRSTGSLTTISDLE